MASAETRGLAEAIWVTRLYRCLVILFIYAFGFAVLVPFLPVMLTNFFASQHAGHDIDCEGLGPGEQPPACQNAHSDVVKWSSITSLVSNTLLTFICAPIVGDWSDTYGRKPFLLVAFTLSLLPVGVIILYLKLHISLLWYYPINAVSGLVSSIVVILSYTADVLQPRERTAGFGLVVAAFSVGFMLGPLLGRQLQVLTAAWVCLGCLVASVLLVLVAVPESLPPSVAQAGATRTNTAAAAAGTSSTTSGRGPPTSTTTTTTSSSSSGGPRAHIQRAHPLDAFLSLKKSWALITSCSLFKKLAVCMAITGVVQEGIQDMLAQYLQLTTGFNTADQGLLFVVIGAANLAVQAVLLPILAPLVGEPRLLLGGLVLSCVEQAWLALIGSKAQAFGAVALGALAGVAYPSISSIKANLCGPDQQGLVQGALAGIRALASGLGPVAFAQLFALSTKTTSALGHHPGFVFWVSCGLTAVAVAVAATISRDAGRPGGSAAGSGGGGYRRVPGAEAPEGVCEEEGGPVKGEHEVGLLSGQDLSAAAAVSISVVGEGGRERHGSMIIRGPPGAWRALTDPGGAP